MEKYRTFGLFHLEEVDYEIRVEGIYVWAEENPQEKWMGPHYAV